MTDLNPEDLDPGHSGPIHPIRLIDWNLMVVGAEDETVTSGQVHREVSQTTFLDLSRFTRNEIRDDLRGADVG